jgi:hypothetical protein
MINGVKKGKVKTIDVEVDSCYRKPAFEGKVKQFVSTGNNTRKVTPKCILVNHDNDGFFALTKMCGSHSLSSYRKEMVQGRKMGTRHHLTLLTRN